MGKRKNLLSDLEGGKKTLTRREIANLNSPVSHSPLKKNQIRDLGLISEKGSTKKERGEFKRITENCNGKTCSKLGEDHLLLLFLGEKEEGCRGGYRRGS